MAAERDEAGPSGPGLSGTGRDASGLNAGTTRSMSMGDAPGTADVHAGIAFNPQAQGGTGTAESGVRGRVKDVAGNVADTASNLGQRARTLAGDVAERAGDLADQARERVGALGEAASDQLEQRGWLGRLRENPLPALGVAFAAGFLLSGGGRGGKGARVKGELRSAVAAGLSAGLAQGARAFLRNAGAEDGVINSLLENLPVLGGGAGGGQGSPRGFGGQGAGAGYGGRGPASSGARPGTARGGGVPSGGRTGGAGGSGRTSGPSYGGGTQGTTHRAPSHRESY